MALAMRTGIPADVWRAGDMRDVSTAFALAEREAGQRNDGR